MAVWWQDTGRKIRFRWAAKTPNTANIAWTSSRRPQREWKVGDTWPRGKKYIVTPGVGLDHTTLKLLNRIIYHTPPTQVGHTGRVVEGDEDGPSALYPHPVKMLGMGQRFHVHLSVPKLNTLTEEPGTLCWHLHVTHESVKKCLHPLA